MKKSAFSGWLWRFRCKNLIHMKLARRWVWNSSKFEEKRQNFQVNRENPQISAQFPDFLFKFLHAFQFLPSDQQTFANSMFLLKIIDLFGSECPKIINFSEISYISRLLELATNVSGDFLPKSLIFELISGIIKGFIRKLGEFIPKRREIQENRRPGPARRSCDVRRAGRWEI